ncbi:transglutaminase-like domain-containing protein [Clostridium sp. WILCCON 0269]|uniref:Transglutaminase-like domain-containing protein n=1 Tax=Candidatus Clostridium eludens TaxID=3381663 RepID=A0ABW8SNH2_9CLOT
MYIPMAIINVILPIILIIKAYIVVDISYIKIILLFIITLVIFEIVNYIKNKKAFLFLLAIFVISAICIVIYKYSYFMSLVYNLMDSAINIDNLTIMNSTVNFSLIFPFYVLIIPGVTFCYLILFKLNLGAVVTLVNTLVLLIYDLIKFNRAVKFILPLYIFLTFINFIICKLGKKAKKNYSKSIIIYYLIICIVLSSITYSFVPYRSGKYTDLAQYKFDKIFNSSDDFYNVSTIGINEGYISFLGKKLQMNRARLSLISGDVPHYLRTKVYYSYNYNRWIENVQLPIIIGNGTLDVPKLIDDNIPNLIDNNNLVKKNINHNEKNGTKIKTLSIENLSNNFSNVMISPNFITKVISKRNSYITMYDNENYLTGQNQSNYTIKFYDYDDIETFEDYYKSKYKDDINNIHENITNNNTNYGIIDNALNFTSSQRVNTLAHKITAKASNNTEKLKLIQNYLLNNYSYDLQPDANDTSSDYADFFLFDEKRGYCMSFATAAVMLCRAIGIPARYVEGFRISDEKDYKGRYVLRSSDAHAWAEVLTSMDKGIWTILETTPNNESEPLNLENTVTKSNIQNMKQEKQSEEPSNSSQINTPPATKKPAVKKMQNNSKKKINTVNLIKKLQNSNYIIIIVCIIILYILIKFLKRKLILKKVIHSESTIPLYTFILRRLKTINIVKQPCETDREFAFRIKDKLDIESLVETVYKEIYGNKENMKNDLNKKFIIVTVEETVKNNSNAFKYYMLL